MGMPDEFPPASGESIGYFRTEYSRVLYDRTNPRAWIETTATVADVLDETDGQ